MIGIENSFEKARPGLIAAEEGWGERPVRFSKTTLSENRFLRPLRDHWPHA
jgi:hypothetical protein